MVLAGNFGQKLQVTILDAPYKYMYQLMDCPKLLACNFRPKLPASNILFGDFYLDTPITADSLYWL